MRWLRGQQPAECFIKRQVDFVKLRLWAGLSGLLSCFHLAYLRGRMGVLDDCQ